MVSNGDQVGKLYAMGENNTPVANRVFGIKDGLRPAFIEFVDCDSVLVEDVTLINGSMWTVHPLYSQNVIIKGITVQTEDGLPPV